MNKNRWCLLMAGTTLIALLAVAGSGLLPVVHSGGRSATGPEVKIDNFSFGPATITVAAGTAVIWTNNDDVPHVIASEDKSFHSKALDTGDKFSYTFTKPGTYLYYCAIHPRMTAKVMVQ